MQNNELNVRLQFINYDIDVCCQTACMDMYQYAENIAVEWIEHSNASTHVVLVYFIFSD